MIGGKDQSGVWKLDARFNKNDLIQRIQRIARYRGRIDIHNLDAVDFIQDILTQLPNTGLVYFDPPYFHKGEDLYDNHYERRDHEQIAELVRRSVRQPWIVSYDLTPEIEGIYSGRPSLKYKIEYTAQMRYAGAEVMFYSDSLILPTDYDPSKVTRSNLNDFITHGGQR